MMRQLKDRGVGIIFVTHFLDQVYEICDRITVMRDGQLVGEYEIEKMPRARPRRRHARQADGRHGRHQGRLHDLLRRRRRRARLRGRGPQEQRGRLPLRLPHQEGRGHGLHGSSRLRPFRVRARHLWCRPRHRRQGQEVRQGHQDLQAARRHEERHRLPARGPQGRRHHRRPLGAREHHPRRPGAPRLHEAVLPRQRPTRSPTSTSSSSTSRRPPPTRRSRRCPAATSRRSSWRAGSSRTRTT